MNGYNDITPRMGAAYDVFGNGKTAIKVNLGKYLQAATNDENYWANNPAGRIVTRVLEREAGWTATATTSSIAICCNPAAQNNLATGGDNCAALDGQRPEFRQPQPQPDDRQSRHPAGLGRPSVRLAVRRVGPAGAGAARLARGQLQPALVRQFLRDGQPLTTAADYDQWTLTVPQNPKLPGGGQHGHLFRRQPGGVGAARRTTRRSRPTTRRHARSTGTASTPT